MSQREWPPPWGHLSQKAELPRRQRERPSHLRSLQRPSTFLVAETPVGRAPVRLADPRSARYLGNAEDRHSYQLEQGEHLGLVDPGSPLFQALPWPFPSA